MDENLDSSAVPYLDRLGGEPSNRNSAYSDDLSVSKPRVWIIGTGEMKDTFDWAVRNNYGSDLDLGTVNVTWHCVRNLHLVDVIPAVQSLLDTSPVPQMIILHVGGNDLQSKYLTEFETTAREVIDAILSEFRNVKLVWSQMLPRWLGTCDAKTANGPRNDLNEAWARYVLDNGGCYMKYPEISLRVRNLFKKSIDGDLSLTQKGLEEIFLILQGGIKSILFRKITIHPSLRELEPLVSDFVKQNLTTGKKFMPIKKIYGYKGQNRYTKFRPY